MKNMYIIFLIIFSILIVLYSRYIGTSGLKIKEYKIVNENINDEFNGLKIVHLTDVHYGTTVDEKRLKSIIEKINMLNPDIVVLTGDLIDERITYNKEEIINSLVKVKAKLGKYAISGNHDYPIEGFDELIEKSGFVNLNNTYELIYNNSNKPIIISGVSSNIADTTDLVIKTKKFDDYINVSNNKPIYSILLMHEPDYIDKFKINNYDLVLSGHSHNGQINIPLLKKLYLPNAASKYSGQYYKIDNCDMYISNGIGTSWLKFRLFSRPSINLYRITNK